MFLLIFSNYKDLHLAAELGKNLLERNQALETQMQHMMHVQNEQKLEIEVGIYNFLIN